MHQLPVSAFSVVSFNMATLTIGTNCPQGGDSGHGGRTIFRFNDDGATVLTASIDDEPRREARSVEIVLGGDSECDTFIELLEKGLDALKAQRAGRLRPSKTVAVE